MRRSPLRRPKPDAYLSARALALRAKRRAARIARAQALHEAQFGPQAELCRRGPCQGCGKHVRCIPHHWPHRKHGGLDRDTCALCPFDCHLAAHKDREAFEAWCGRTVSSMVEEMRERLAVRTGGAVDG